jgi:hypothetical protein
MPAPTIVPRRAAPQTLISRLFQTLVDDRRLEQRDAEVGEAPQEPLELGLVADAPDEQCRSILSGKGHPLERWAGRVGELPFDAQSVLADGHFAKHGGSRHGRARWAPRSPMRLCLPEQADRDGARPPLRANAHPACGK